ncbi:MAG: hypothetical protein DKINENOH_05503 [bacterium]|nr:hypothetical protein [bacterium]
MGKHSAFGCSALAGFYALSQSAPWACKGFLFRDFTVAASDLHSPKVFISHSWTDKPLVLELEEALRQAGAAVWVDHVGIRGGDSLPKRISDALEWCDTLLLIWSQAASESEWVALEWESAISLKKKIVPCLLDGTKLPGILANKAYINFRDAAKATTALLGALGLDARPPAGAAAKETVAAVPHGPLTANQETAPAPQAQPKPAKAKTADQKPLSQEPSPPQPPKPLPPSQKVASLRSQPVKNFSADAVPAMLKKKGFFHSFWNEQCRGLQHQYESVERNGAKLVIDHATGLTWQQGGSKEWVNFAEAQKYLEQLNREKFAGYSDWRLPTLEEAMSLMEPEKRNGDLHIDPVFDKNQRWIWTADQEASGGAWCVRFSFGTCDRNDVLSNLVVRAVRSGQS